MGASAAAVSALLLRGYQLYQLTTLCEIQSSPTYLGRVGCNVVLRTGTCLLVRSDNGHDLGAGAGRGLVIYNMS